MSNEYLIRNIGGSAPSATFDESGEFLTVTLPAGDLLPLMRELRFNGALDFDYLFNLTCVDWKDHLMMVYHLVSKSGRHQVVVKARISDIVNPEVESVNGLWRTAELLEDEVYDMFGVRFLNHPNLRRLFMDEDWKGYPLRKNYTDENMIKL